MTWTGGNLESPSGSEHERLSETADRLEEAAERLEEAAHRLEETAGEADSEVESGEGERGRDAR